MLYKDPTGHWGDENNEGQYTLSKGVDPIKVDVPKGDWKNSYIAAGRNFEKEKNQAKELAKESLKNGVEDAIHGKPTLGFGKALVQGAIYAVKAVAEMCCPKTRAEAHDKLDNVLSAAVYSIGVKGGSVGVASTELENVGSVVSKCEKPLYRNMSKAEAEAVKKTGLLRGGNEGETYWTDSRFRNAAKAQDRLSLPNKPEVQMEFNIKNNPTLQRNGTRVTPDNGGKGGGKEYMSTDSVKVEVINVQPYSH